MGALRLNGSIEVTVLPNIMFCNLLAACTLFVVVAIAVLAAADLLAPFIDAQNHIQLHKQQNVASHSTYALLAAYARLCGSCHGSLGSSSRSANAHHMLNTTYS